MLKFKLIVQPVRNFKPPHNVFDFAYLNKNHVPSRAATKRENWARFGSDRSKVRVDEIIPSFDSFKQEAKAERNWWFTLNQQDANVKKVYKYKQKEDKVKLRLMTEGIPEQQVLKQKVVQSKLDNIEWNAKMAEKRVEKEIQMLAAGYKMQKARKKG